MVDDSERQKKKKPSAKEGQTARDSGENDGNKE
jgi:hypothetical protein